MSKLQCRCNECGWEGEWDDLTESDEGINLCPECHADTSDILDDQEDLGDERSS